MTLTGTPKQVAWASVIRTERLPDIDAFVDLCLGDRFAAICRQAREYADLDADGVRTALESARVRLHEQQSAEWWIDRRKSTYGGILQRCGISEDLAAILVDLEAQCPWMLS